MQQVIEAVLVADFDIDVGSSLSAYYPPQYVEQNLKVSSLAELMLPDGAHLREEDWTVFFLRHQSDSNQLLHVINLVRTKKVASNRGARVKGMALVSRHPFVHVFKPLLVLALERYFASSTDQLLQTMFEVVNKVDFSSMPQLSLVQKQILRGGCSAVLLPQVNEPDSCAEVSALICQPKKFTRVINETTKLTFDGIQYQWETKMKFDGINVPVKVPFDLYPDEVGEYSVSHFVNTFHSNTKQGDPSGVMLILHSILSQRRVLFMGAQMPACEVAKYVLAAISLFAPVLRGLTSRAFPYTCLSNIENVLKVDGFIAGVTNPAFQTHDEWYDILCDISTGQVTISPKLKTTTAYGYTQADPLKAEVSAISLPKPSTDGASQKPPEVDKLEKELINQDNEFMNEVFTLVSQRSMDSEVRHKFRGYVRRFVQIAALYEFQLQRLGVSAFNGILSKGSPLMKRLTAQSATESHASILDMQVPKGFYTLHKDVNFPNSLGPRAVLPSAEVQKKQLQLYSKRINSWKNTSSYINYQQDWQEKLAQRVERYKGNGYDQNQVAADDFLGALYNYDMLTKEGNQFVISFSQVGNDDTPAFGNETFKMPAAVAVQNGLYFDDSDIERLVGQLQNVQNFDSATVYKILTQICASIKIESQLMQLFALLPLNEGGLTVLTSAMFHKDALIRGKCLELLHIIWKNDIGKMYVAKMNSFCLQALTALEKEAAQKELLAQRRLHTHDEQTLKHLTPIVTSIDSVQYNPSYMSFSENSLHKATNDSEESLVFDEGMDFISQYSLQDVSRKPTVKDFKTLTNVQDDIERSEEII